MRLSPGHVICPPCSGSGCGWKGSTGECGSPCRLCEGRGEIHADLAQDFWDCIGPMGAKGPQFKRCLSV